jgi:hypothetical protein
MQGEPSRAAENQSVAKEPPLLWRWVYIKLVPGGYSEFSERGAKRVSLVQGAVGYSVIA